MADNRPTSHEEWELFFEQYGEQSVDAFIEMMEMDDTVEYQDDEFWGRPDTEIDL